MGIRDILRSVQADRFENAGLSEVPRTGKKGNEPRCGHSWTTEKAVNGHTAHTCKLIITGNSGHPGPHTCHQPGCTAVTY